MRALFTDGLRLACLLLALPVAAEWRPLFNGKDFTEKFKDIAIEE